MEAKPPISAECLIPILYVRDFAEAMNYYTKKLLFKKLWDWGDPPTFGAVGMGKIEIFFCLKDQGRPGSWLSIFIDDVDDYGRRIKKLGAEIIHGPVDEPWGVRELLVRDPNKHVIRFGHAITIKTPDLKVERVPVAARLEKRLAALLKDLAEHKRMTVGETLEETLLHTFERVDGSGVASPHTARTLAYIQELKKKHKIDYDVHASYRFFEKSGRKRKKKH